MSLIEKVMGTVQGVFKHPAPAVAAVAWPAVPQYPAGYLVAINRILGLEGGYSNDPKDPGNWTGGRLNAGVLKGTKFGISAASYPDLDIANLTRDDAIAIYFRDFWSVVNAGAMPPAVAFQALDFAVNSGPGTAIKKLQTALGVKADGAWGPVTQQAVATLPAGKLGALLLAERLDFLRALPGWIHDGAGWAGRVAKDLRYLVLDT